MSRATAPETPVYYGPADEMTCLPLLPDWRRRMADIFAEQASAETVAGEVAQAWLAEGAARTLRQILPRLVRVRFGVVLPAELLARLLQCSLEELHILQAAVETCTSLDAWLHTLTDLRP